jgi:iron complex transport system substrate-binding protein
MSRKFLLPFLPVLAILLGACGPGTRPTPETPPAVTAVPRIESNFTPGAIVLIDGLGRTVSLTAPARRIVSLAPSNTEILFAIGAGLQVIGRDHFSDYPEETRNIADIGTTTDKLNTELILSLKPDLVLAAGINPPEQVKALEDLGLTVFLLANPTDLDGMYSNLRTAAELTGHTDATNKLIASLQARVQAVQSKVENVRDRPLVFYELDGGNTNSPWTSGPGTFVDCLITMAGGRDVGSILQSDWAQIGLEELIRQNPDLILLGDATLGGVTAAMVKQRPGWEEIAAVKNDRIFPFDDNLVSRPGPRLVDGLEALAKLLHPDLFR